MGVPQLILLSIGFTMVQPVLQSVVPYRLRGMGSALGSIYIFFIGATGGALLSGLLTDEFGSRTAVIVIMVPSTIVGGFLILRGAAFIRNDLSLVVAELQEEMAEHRRQQESPTEIPALQVADIDFSYGSVQVLFDVGFEVRTRRGARVARHQRRRQVDDPARHRRPRDTRHAVSSVSTAAPSRTPRPSSGRSSGSASCSAARACSRR